MFNSPTAEETALAVALPLPRAAHGPLCAEGLLDARLIAELALTFDLEALIAEASRDPFRC